MTALPTPTDDHAALDGAVFEAVGDTLATAAGYIDIAARSVDLRDARSLAYSLRCACAAVASAGEMVAELRPSQRGGRRS